MTKVKTKTPEGFVDLWGTVLRVEHIVSVRHVHKFRDYGDHSRTEWAAVVRTVDGYVHNFWGQDTGKILNAITATNEP